MLLSRVLVPALLPLLLVVGLPLYVTNSSTDDGPGALPSLAEPAISPDRSEVAFVSGGDIWTVPATGGEARLLITHPATESRPLYSPDGRMVAFVSTRTGNGDIYVLTMATGELRRITFDDGLDQLDAWSSDGRWIYFSSSSRDVAAMNDIFRVSVDGGTPMQVSADRYTSEFFAAPSPDGRSLAFSARGISSRQWWRKGSSHIDQSEIWLLQGDREYRRIIEGGAKNLWPMWTPDGSTIHFVSDRGGVENIWSYTLRGQLRQVTRFASGRVLWPSISADGRAIVFERNFGIWKLDTGTGQASEIRARLRGTASSPAPQRITMSDRFQSLALSPDGKKIAFVARGEVFAASAKDSGEATRVTTTTAVESEVVWSPDSKKLAYVSERDGSHSIYSYDFTTNAETRLTVGAASGSAGDYSPRFSPDGSAIAFIRGGRDLRLLKLESKEDRSLASLGADLPPLTDERPFDWSPDGKWIAFMSVGDKLFRNIHVVRVEGGDSRQVSFLSNIQNSTVSWSPDGKFLLFDTGQRTEGGQVARIDLTPRLPRFREDQFRDLFKDPPSRQLDGAAQPQASGESTAKKDERKDVEIEFDGIRRRLSLVPLGLDVATQTISPDGKWLLVSASAAGQFNLYVYSLDELATEPAVPRQLTSTAGFKSSAQFSPDSKEVYFLAQGRINIVAIESRAPRPLAVTAQLDVDFEREKMQVFHQAWSYLRDHFYDERFHGADWAAVRETYAPRVAAAQTPDEMRRVISLMIGELNASHLNITPPPGSGGATTGRVGFRFDRGEYEANGRLRITEVIPLSPAALSGDIKAGDYLLALDGTRIDARTNLDELLDRKIRRRVTLTVATSVGGESREVVVQPVNAATENGLLYRKWVEDNRGYVERASGGRLGYVHMPDMSAGSLARLYVDLDSENQLRDGVVIDVRNNNGGFVNVYAIDVFARRDYLTMSLRGLSSAPARTVLGQRALGRQTILLTNQHSLSDAEDFTEGYRALKLGKVVGEPTAGWIIYTWGVSLIDGSGFRLPRMKVTGSDGRVMELNPRPVDIPVQRPIGETYSERDSQLDSAVQELMKQIPGR